MPLRPLQSLRRLRRGEVRSVRWPALTLVARLVATRRWSERHESHDRSRGDESGFRDLSPWLQQDGEGGERDGDRAGTGDDVLADDDRSARDGACGGGGCALDEAEQAWVVLVAADVAARDDDEQQRGQKDADGRDDRAGDAEDQVAG